MAQYILLARLGDDVVRPVDEDVPGLCLGAHDGLLDWLGGALLESNWTFVLFTL